MDKVPLLWNSGAQKEVYDLLREVGKSGDKAAIAAVSEALALGPPSHLLDHIDTEDRSDSWDRRVFDRASVLAEVDGFSLPENLMKVIDTIRARHPQWRAVTGERSGFSVWTEFGRGTLSKHSASKLATIQEDDQLLNVILAIDEDREGLVNAWREFVAIEPSRALKILASSLEVSEGSKPDIWSAALLSYQSTLKDLEQVGSLLQLISQAPGPFFDDAEFVYYLANFLEKLSQGDYLPDPIYWLAFERALEGIDGDPQSEKRPDDDDWVMAAINSSVGNLSTALLNCLYKKSIKANDGIPDEYRRRADLLVAPSDHNRRLARVIAYSRLPYLFAIDPEWARSRLLIGFQWQRDEDEAVAAWRGFSWHPTVSPDLWGELKSSFIEAFTPQKLPRLGDAAETLAQILMLVGVEFKTDELTREQAQGIMRNMSNTLRERALWWINSYLEQTQQENTVGAHYDIDVVWRDRIEPWLKHAWPRDKILQSRECAEQFARMAVATSDQFEQAVLFIKPFLMPIDEALVLDELMDSNHPDRHPAAVLQLLDPILHLEQIHVVLDLAAILNRIVLADASLSDDPRYKKMLSHVSRRS